MNTINKITKAVFTLLLALSTYAYSQTEMPEKKVYDLPKVILSEGVSLHIISPEPIQFVDLSSNNIIGDLPTENIARIKILDEQEKDSTGVRRTIDKNNLGIVTIVGQSFMVQYKLEYRSYDRDAVTNIQVQPEDMQPLDYPKMELSKMELQSYAFDILKNKKPATPIRESKDFKMQMQLNNVYVVDNYIFLDITFQNKTNLPYSIDGLNFSIDDKQIYKATNNQSLDILPVFKLYHQKDFRKTFRNIYVFKKFTYPNSKVLNIRLVEEQLSGRTIEMKIKYSDILKADTF